MDSLVSGKESIPGNDLNDILLSFPNCTLSDENRADSYFLNTLKTIKKNEKIVNSLHKTVSDIKTTLNNISNIKVVTC